MSVTKLKLRIYGDPCLRKKSIPVKEVGVIQRKLIEAMIETMHDQKGVGLAAPQVGINEQIFVADTGDGPFVFVNPRIIKKSGSEILEEGCLSIPAVMVKIKRPTKVTVRYLNEFNQPVEEEYTELLARVIQHETDHLNGKLIIDYAGLGEKKKIKEQLKQIIEQKE